MHYMLLIYGNEADWASLSRDEMEKAYAEYGEFERHLVEKGHYQAGHELQPVETATTVRVRGGETLLTDGPFAETKEQLGGYFLVEAADLDEALELAARCPGARHGTVEVRPVQVHPGGPGDGEER